MGSIINPNEKQTWAITAQGITVMGKTKSFNTYEEMLRSPDPGLINYVTDATGDPTVKKGFAVYRYANGIFTKIYEGESMDQDIGITYDWKAIVNGPTSSPADIDAAVAQKHEHANLETLNALSSTTDAEGVINALLVNGVLLATKEQVDELTAKVSGALSFKGVVENQEALPAEDNTVGDVYVTKDGKEFVYTDAGFEEFGSTVDLSGYYTKEEVDYLIKDFLPLTNGVFSGLKYMEEAAVENPVQNIVVLGATAIMNRISIGQQDPAGFDVDKLYSFKYFEAGPKGMKGFVDYLKSKGVSSVITDAIRTNGVQIQDTGKKISDLVVKAELTEGLALKVDKEEGKVLSSNDFTAEEKAKLAELANYDDTGVKELIAQEEETRIAADASLTSIFEQKQNKINVDGQELVLNNDTLSLGEDVVVMVNPYDQANPNRRHILLKNHDSIVGTMTSGDNGSLLMMSKWDKVDIGTTKAQMNLNSPNGVVQVNDEAIVVTSANIAEYAPVTDLSDYYNKSEVDAKVSGVFSYKGRVEAVADLPQDAKVGDVYFVTEKSSEYAYDGTKWEELGSVIDLSAYATTVTVNDLITAAKDELASEIEAESTAREEADTSLDNRVTEAETKIADAQTALEGKQDKLSGSTYVTVDNNMVALTDMVPTYVHPAGDNVRKHIVLANHDSIIGALSDGSNNVTLLMLSKWDKAEVGSAQVTLNLNTKDNVLVNDTDIVVTDKNIATYAPKYDDAEVKASIEALDVKIGANTTALDGKVDKAEGYSLVADTEITRLASVDNYDDTEVKGQIASVSVVANTASAETIAVKDRLASLEAQIVALKQTDVAAVTSSADLVQADKDLIITIAEPVTGVTTVEGKSIEVKALTATDATTILKTTGDVTVKNLTTTGDLPKATANAQVRIPGGSYVRITDSSIDQTGYNAIEIGLGTGSGPSATKSIVIDNVKINATLSNNAINIFATEDGSVVTISNCTITKCSNPIRLSNATGGKVTINIVNCEFTEWDGSNEWAGMVIMQDYTNKTVEEIQANNLFGPDKVTINVINCTHAGEKIVAPENIADVCGTQNAATQMFYIWNEPEGFVAYSADRYPVINIQ